MKYRDRNGELVADETSGDLALESLLIAKKVAGFYSAALPPVATGRLLDLGSGRSPMRAFYEPMVTDVRAIDWPGSLHETRVDVWADLNCGVPIATASVDTIVLSDVLEHLHSPRQLLAEARRVLRPGGCLVGNVPFMYWLHEVPHDYFRYTEHGLRALLDDSGFAHHQIHVIGGGVDVLVDITGKLLVQVPVIGRLATRLLLSAWSSVSSTSIAARLNRRPAQMMPLGYGFTATA